MYESHFGFSGTPFNLNPDPAFYFQSKGHGSALSYLRFGVYQGEGFVVVTGEIGAGKTTLVRTLLSELDDQKIVAAQIVSTQLEAGDLLRSVAIAFGIAPKSLSKAELIASIEAFLTLLVTQNKRALLIVDEAQNLQLQAIEELRMLSNFQLGNHALLQSFLVGQPELRQLLTSKPMEQFRQRVIASCHLGPMDAGETRAYIEHRLHKVGWDGAPGFEPAAFERIHHWTAGTPRRVNLLCNRLLLAAYLASASTIDAAEVDKIAGEVLAEVGEAKAHLAPLTDPITHDAAPEGAARGERAVTRVQVRTAAREAGPILFVAATRADDVKLAALMQTLQGRDDALPLALVRIGDPSLFAPNDEFQQQLGIEVPVVELGISEATASGRIAEVIRAFEPVFELHEPCAIVVAGSSDAALACSIVASKRGCMLIHADLALCGTAGLAADTNAGLLARLAIDLGPVPPTSDRPPIIGLTADAVALARSKRVAPAMALRHAGPALRALVDKQGHALVALDTSIEFGDRRRLTALLTELREASSVVPLVWPLQRATAARLEAFGLRTFLKSERIAVLAPLNYSDFIGLMEGARCVLTDSRDVLAEAQLLDVPCLSLGLGPAREGGAVVASSYSKTALESSLRQARPSSVRAAAATPRASNYLADMLIERLRQQGLDVPSAQRQLGS